ncbi:UDP-2,4-diacetamido-2,4,6-trideoxy-beta-L-altropyranose hydrolase [Bacillus niameyensis]|uniref:UDP-2,4-diacetamido-2,4, 6-trideoxy-beta-L-altropyranose hydrolase n=1 Tax=Bacillus niameyensis TaxID=1522308 RepID=UPI000780524E|nr:UDP-2,4-diacetamido-2,4,6-trideoxy-beta-L-altropyranose hydrolase [Bacillus niameyensis]
MPRHWSNRLKVVFRADASTELGSGHISRCLILAEKLHEVGAKVSFICRADEGNLCHLLWTKGFVVTTIGRITNFSMKTDMKETIGVLQMMEQVDWLIIDHYQLDYAWEHSMRPYVKKIMVIDDLANRKHDCDVLLDQTFGVQRYSYSTLIPESCQLLLGSSFALLKAPFKTYQKRVPPSFKTIRKVHVFFGGMDLKNFTYTYSLLLLENFPYLHLRIIVGKHYPYTDLLQLLQEKYRERVQWEQDVPNMAESLAECEVALGAPGITTWERACVGLPAAYLAIADNQINIVEDLDEKGLCVYLGQANSMKSDEFIHKFHRFIHNERKLGELYKNSVRNVDGYGVERVIPHLLGKE